MPICFRQSTDDPSRLIFRAGSRSNWVFDLRMYKGGLRLWSEKAMQQGLALRLQRKPFVRDIDMIDRNLFNILTLDSEGKWKRYNSKNKERRRELGAINLKETLLRELPVIVQCP